MLTESELNEVKGLMHYLNEHLRYLKVDNIQLMDPNGNMTGEIVKHPDTDDYVLVGLTRY